MSPGSVALFAIATIAALFGVSGLFEQANLSGSLFGVCLLVCLVSLFFGDRPSLSRPTLRS